MSADNVSCTGEDVENEQIIDDHDDSDEDNSIDKNVEK